MPPRLLSIVCVVLALSACNDASSGAGKAAANRAAPETPAPAPPPVVGTVNPQYETRTNVLETSGKVQFNEDRLVRVQSPVTGRVVEVVARTGDVVEPGHRLVVLDSPDLAQAKSDYAKAIADGDRSDKALRLTRELYEAKAVAQKEVREAENDYRKATAERERAASRLRTLGITDEHLREVGERADTTTRVAVTAPRSGVIVERNVNPGQVVAYGQSDTPLNLFVIADLSAMWVLADVYEPDIPKVRLGQSITVTPPCCPDQRFEGRVSYISDIVDKETRTVKVRAVVPNRGRALKAEMFVKVRIGTDVTRVLAMPQSAVHRENGDTFVLIDRGNGTYARRPVRLGADFDGVVEVLDGVTPNDQVVTSGGILLKKNAK
jgi:cobalt-zinc-cadmium efflux system membrane fusion protein